jgi:hypothetical protein
VRTSVNHNHWVRICLGSWVVYGLVLGALVLLQPYSHSLTPFYAEAAFNFWSAHVEELNALHGFYYLPVARLLFTPFAFAGIAVGGLLWWMVGYGLITLSAWQWARLLVPGERSRAFAMILVVTLPASAAVLRNGQFDAPTWALMALGAAAVGGGQWWRAAAALGFALAIKPNAIVAIMLIGVIWLPVGLRLMPFIAVLLAIPYINPNWTYVNELYVSWIHQTVDALPQPGRWNNLANALAYFGIDIPYQTMTFVWLVAAVATLVFGLATARQLPRIHAAFVVLMLTSSVFVAVQSAHGRFKLRRTGACRRSHSGTTCLHRGTLGLERSGRSARDPARHGRGGAAHDAPLRNLAWPAVGLHFPGGGNHTARSPRRMGRSRFSSVSELKAP